MGFDSKRKIAPPAILLGLLLCPLMQEISSQSLQPLPSYWGFSDLGCGVSLHGCSSKAQPLLLTLDEGYLLTAALYDLERGIAEVERRGSKNTQKNCAKKIFTTQIITMV